MANIEATLAELEALGRKGMGSEALRRAVASLLSGREGYDWTGFYMLEEGPEPMLALDAFVGEPTEHVRIPLNRGLCGAAAASGETIVVDDVRADSRYLACSWKTRSEIVAPIYAGGRVVGELDVDSHQPSAFDADERALCERAAALVGAAIEAEA